MALAALRCKVCTEVIGRYDQEIARYLGDGLLVYFGYPRAHEDYPVQRHDPVER